MNNCTKEYVYKLLYSNNVKDTIEDIQNITDSKLLHIIAGNYNYDNGFEIPSNILKNEYCDLGTALMIFYDADGYRILENREEVKNSKLKEWTSFVFKIEEEILNDKLKLKDIKFIPPLSKVQIFKLKKNNPDINNVFLEESDGDIVEIPNI